MRFGDIPEEADGTGQEPAERLCAQLAMELEDGSGLRLRVRTELRYRADDPLAVRLTFHLPGDQPVNWTIARDLLLDGMGAPAGEGDVHVRPHPGEPDAVQLLLHAPGGSASISVGLAPLHAVLLRTDLMVPFGAELTEGQLERGLAELLAEAGRD
ncbi:SsgA family sporulation/cell division regulator [Kitasatospora sp. NPDC002040]|uniref:SsgA family sporulation/cell division regulator n=1 Tax=Kitasatospora sp. NPDC002040 TaxID=3154661 RepID=UPI00332CFE3A